MGNKIKKIFIGADHRGFYLKKHIRKLLGDKGYDVIDVGVHKEGVLCDYPQYSYKVARSVVSDKDARGILVCMTGLGHAIAANKVPGARATLCYNKQAARFARAHNNSNILILGAKFTPRAEIAGIITTWMNTEFDGGRHARRMNQVRRIEKKCLIAKCS